VSDCASKRSNPFETRRGTPQEALEFFDSLQPVDIEFMIGRWRGFEITTGHPQDGILEATRWYGKEFEDAETVHPLLHLDGRGNLFRVRPRPSMVYASLRHPWLKSQPLQPVSRFVLRLLKTERSQARLRMVEYRGELSATMIYDALPINDHFRRVDENTVMGIMDFKGLSQPYPFGLERVE